MKTLYSSPNVLVVGDPEAATTTKVVNITINNKDIASMEEVKKGGVSIITTNSTLKIDNYASQGRGSQVLLRFLCLFSSLMALRYMLGAKENGYIDRLPIQSSWSYSYVYLYLVGITAIVVGYSLTLCLNNLVKKAPYGSRKEAFFAFLVDQLLAIAMLTVASVALGVTKPEQNGIYTGKAALPDYCQPLSMFCKYVERAVIYTFLGSFLLAGSATLHVIWLFKN
ncbi:hypothetical protein ACFE04_008596 [Oxalis oulophora]